MISETIKNRRAVFPAQYNRQPISKEEVKKILETANWAPTHRKTEPWRFKVFHSEESRKQLADFLSETYKNTTETISEFKQKKIAEKPLQSGCVIAICMQRDPKESVPAWEEIAATAMAVQNMWLTAHDMKIGAYWSSPALKDHLHALINLNEGERCLGFFYMGKFDELTLEGARNTTIQEKTTWV
ncbi:MAG: nitroreductase [Flavobacteriaceae bacterium]|jgi:nitroreductase|nr:nitroreductase [Flavobacteriaceae bacterium]MAO11353.1 nitroreductase [Flavobacteriaceae bacterium]HBY70024.1 nitroreductase [Flavobacteriaceae bacterium]|tara:strand:- start:51 stop:608 length:558 start_codon:yes stop_codon:yes gene_type:complete